jgi:hypothetical protein
LIELEEFEREEAIGAVSVSVLLAVQPLDTYFTLLNRMLKRGRRSNWWIFDWLRI